MKRTHTQIHANLGVLGLALLVLGLLAPPVVQAQDRPSQRQIRTYIPPDQLVSFLPETPFDQFVAFLNPIFQRVTGKQVIDPEGYSNPIGISIAGMHFLDAFELVLDFNGLSYRETDQYFIVQEAPEVPVAASAEQATGRAAASAAAPAELPATSETREVQINAILFEMNVNKARDIGLDWSVFLGEESGSSGGGSNTGSNGGGTGANQMGTTRFFLKSDELFEDLDDYIQAPELMDFADLASFFRLLEDEGVGETVANPQVTVQSGQQGRIQIGSDIPIQTRDFAGNTVTQFFSTGIIIDVLPTLIAETDTSDNDELEFIHMDVRVENSSGRPSTAGTVIDRNTADTQVLLLDGEQTVIGGLYSTQESFSRRGIPILKDLPNWFFGLGYIFGRTVRTTIQKELLIVLQAEMLDPVTARAERPLQRNLLEQRRRDIQTKMGTFSEEVSRRTPLPPVND